MTIFLLSFFLACSDSPEATKTTEAAKSFAEATREKKAKFALQQAQMLSEKTAKAAAKEVEQATEVEEEERLAQEAERKSRPIAVDAAVVEKMLLDDGVGTGDFKDPIAKMAVSHEQVESPLLVPGKPADASTME